MCKNVTKGNFSLTRHQKTNLCHRKNDMRALSSKKPYSDKNRQFCKRVVFCQFSYHHSWEFSEVPVQVMQSAKKLALIDEKHGSEYKRLQRPADAVAKTRKSVELPSSSRPKYHRRSKNQRILRSSTPISKRSQRSARR